MKKVLLLYGFVALLMQVQYSQGAYTPTNQGYALPYPVENCDRIRQVSLDNSQPVALVGRGLVPPHGGQGTHKRLPLPAEIQTAFWRDRGITDG